MVASWMIYSLVVGALLVVAATLAERVLRLMRLPVRGAWAAAMLLAVTVPLVTALRPGPVTEVEATAAGAVESLTLTLEAEPFSAGLPALPAFPALDLPLLAAWALLSLTLLAALLHGVGVLQGRRREWQRTQVDGREVLVATGLGPAVIGWRRMEIVLPAWALTLDREARQLILAHEEEHIRRRDPGLLFAGLISALILPWNAGLWYLYRRLRLAIELDCDARVVATGADLARYGEVLLVAGARTQGGRLPALATFAERATQLESRITALTATPERRRGPKALAVATLAAAVLVTACTIENPLGIDLRQDGPQTYPRSTAVPPGGFAPVTVGQSLSPVLRGLVNRMAEQRFPGAIAAGGIPREAVIIIIQDRDRGIMSASMLLSMDPSGAPSGLSEIPGDQIESIEVIKGGNVGIENLGVILATVKPGTMLRKRSMEVPEGAGEWKLVAPNAPAAMLRRQSVEAPETGGEWKEVSPIRVPAVLLRRSPEAAREAPEVRVNPLQILRKPGIALPLTELPAGSYRHRVFSGDTGGQVSVLLRVPPEG